MTSFKQNLDSQMSLFYILFVSRDDGGDEKGWEEVTDKEGTGCTWGDSRDVKSREELVVKCLAMLFNTVQRVGVALTDWRKAQIIPIYKKGSWLKCFNYRGISSLSVVQKVNWKSGIHEMKSDRTRRKVCVGAIERRRPRGRPRMRWIDNLINLHIYYYRAAVSILTCISATDLPQWCRYLSLIGWLMKWLIDSIFWQWLKDPAESFHRLQLYSCLITTHGYCLWVQQTLNATWSFSV